MKLISRLALAAALAAAMLLGGVTSPVNADTQDSSETDVRKKTCRAPKFQLRVNWDESDPTEMKLRYGWSSKNCKGRIAQVTTYMYIMAPNGAVEDEQSGTYVVGADQRNKKLSIGYWTYVKDSGFATPRKPYLNSRDYGMDRAFINCSRLRDGTSVNISNYRFLLAIEAFDSSGRMIGKKRFAKRVSCGQNFPFTD